MALPVDIHAVLAAATNTEEEARAPIAVSVYLDDTAPGECIAFVRGLFAGATGANARVSIMYLEDGVQMRPNDDMAVLVAGTGPGIGKAAADIRASGVPVMVATNLPAIVADAACADGYPIPAGDLITPVKQLGFLALKRAQKEGAAPTEAEAQSDAPIELTDEAQGEFRSRIGNWIIAACPDKRLAFAHAFPFVRRPLAQEAITSTSVQNAGIGLLPIIPGADMPIMTLNQAKMLMQIAAAYGEPLNKERLPELAALVGNAFLCRSIARSLAKAVPVAGLAISGAIGFTATEAVGRAAIEYFEAGGNAAGLANVAKRAVGEGSAAMRKAAATPAGKAVLDAAKRGAKGAVSLLRGKARR